jgi:hypothetical protein
MNMVEEHTITFEFARENLNNASTPLVQQLFGPPNKATSQKTMSNFWMKSYHLIVQITFKYWWGPLGFHICCSCSITMVGVITLKNEHVSKIENSPHMMMKVV